jgi:hypothetical protein
MNKKNLKDLLIPHNRLVLENLIKIFLLLFFGIFMSCKGRQESTDKPYNVRTDFRMGSKFYSIWMNENGKAYAIKGEGSFYTEPLKILTSDTSEVFKMDSVKQFYGSLEKMKKQPIIGSNYMGAPRVEIYCDGQQIYDSYRWNEAFWDLFRPIMHQIPKGFNPFLTNDRPF